MLEKNCWGLEPGARQLLMSPQCVRQPPVLWAIRDKQHRVTLFSGERFVSWLQLNNFSPLAHAMSLCRDQETFLLPRGRVGERADAERHRNEGEWASLMLTLLCSSGRCFLAWQGSGTGPSPGGRRGVEAMLRQMRWQDVLCWAVPRSPQSQRSKSGGRGNQFSY